MDTTPVEMPIADLAYLAGLFDGEGSVILSRNGATLRRPSGHYDLTVAVVMADACGPETFQQWFGGTLRLSFRAKYNRRQLYAWAGRAWRAVRVLRTLGPYLRIKNRQADLGISFMETKQREIRGKHRVPAELIARRDAMWDEMGALNHSHWRRRRLASSSTPHA